MSICKMFILYQQKRGIVQPPQTMLGMLSRQPDQSQLAKLEGDG